MDLIKLGKVREDTELTGELEKCCVMKMKALNEVILETI